MANKVFEPQLIKLENLFEQNFCVPVYQRPYSWEKEQIETLLKDIWETYNSEEKDDGYFTGNIIVYISYVDFSIDTYDIIDGQQRITTFALLLLALYCKCYNMNIDSNEETVLNLKKSLWRKENREYKKEKISVTLNSIERECFYNLFVNAFDNPKEIINFCNNYTAKSDADKRIIDNFIQIYNYLDNFNNDKTDILYYADYILEKIKFILIESNCKEAKVFSIFESLNSKGKKLDTIDLIKSYIFSQINVDNHKTYLKKWGDLIIQTHDKLYEYISVFIKAYINYYQNKISIVNFKKVTENEMMKFYEVDTKEEALRKFLDDLLIKVKYFNMLSSIEEAKTIINNSKFSFFYLFFTKMSYVHPMSIFFRLLVDLDKNKIIKKEDVILVVSKVIKYMIIYSSICGKDSKVSSSFFEDLMDDVIKNGINSKEIEKQINNIFIKQGLTDTTIKEGIRVLDAYDKSKLTVALLALYYSLYNSKNGKAISYDNAYNYLVSYGQGTSIDHICPRNPKLNLFVSYYENNGIVEFKEENDFPLEAINLEYNTFISNYLNKIGNLQILNNDINSSKSNNIKSDFNTWNDICDRTNEIINVLVDEIFKMI